MLEPGLLAQAPIEWNARLAALPRAADDEVVVAAVGDMMISDPVTNRTLPEVRALYQVLSDADVAFGNCEEAIASRGTLRGGLPQTAPLEMFDDFRTSGFDMLSMANNHGLDLGEAGLLQQIQEARARGFTIAGLGRNLAEATTPGVVTAKGQRVGLLAFLAADEGFQQVEELRATAGKSGVALIVGTRVGVPGSPMPMLLPHDTDMRAMVEAIKRARSECDVLMVSLHQHWNLDLPPNAGGAATRPPVPQPRTVVPAQLTRPVNLVAEGRKLICRTAIDAGADLVIGHGPHVLNGIEVYRNKPILYSLGHFYLSLLRDGKALPRTEISPTMARNNEVAWLLEEHRWSAVARVFFSRGTVTRVQILPACMDVQKDGLPFFPGDGDSQTINNALRELSRPFQTDIRTVGWYSEVQI